MQLSEQGRDPAEKLGSLLAPPGTKVSPSSKLAFSLWKEVQKHTGKQGKKKYPESKA